MPRRGRCGSQRRPAAPRPRPGPPRRPPPRPSNPGKCGAGGAEAEQGRPPAAGLVYKPRPMPSFDIVSKVAWNEIDNALNQAEKEIAQRFDFKGTGAEIEKTSEGIVI